MKIDISQSIGVCYRDERWAEELLDEILNQAPENIIEKRMKNGINFIDGSYIRTFPCTDTCRGRKFNKLYVQEGIDEEYIDTYLRPCLCIRNLLRERVIDSTGKTYFW